MNQQDGVFRKAWRSAVRFFSKSMPLNEAAGFRRSNLTRQQKDEAEAAITGAQESEVEQPKPQVHDINNPPRTQYLHQEFPKCVYHPDGPSKVVNSQEEFDALGEEWAAKPFPPKVEEECDEVEAPRPSKKGKK